MNLKFDSTKVVITVLLIVCSLFALAQSPITISGNITDKNGEAMIGASVVVQGSTNGAITDINGNFKFQAKKGDQLIIKMLGMKQQTYVVSDNTPMKIVLEDNAEELDEVVINGFQTVDRKLFTGVATHLNMSDIKIDGIVDASRMLDGRVAGVVVDNVSGTFGTSPKIRIRGNASINGNNQPLFVVDGVILEDLTNVNTNDFTSGNASTLTGSSIANINPADIDSYQILKDASATAIYGARAANGVVVITTKRGKSGALKVAYTGNFSVQLRPTYKQFNLLNSAEEMSVYRELYHKGNIDITTSVGAESYGSMGKMFTLISQKQIPWGTGGTLNEKFLNQYENANTDWFDVLFNDLGLQQQHSLSFTSGSEKSTNYYSLSFLNDQGQTISDHVDRLTATARNTYRPTDKFTFGLKLTGSYRKQKAPGTRNREFDPITGSYTRNFDINPLSFALNTSRSMRPYDENGDLEYFRRNYADFNILDELKYNFIDIEVFDISTQADFDVNPTKNLSVKGVVQMRYANTSRDHTVHEKSNQAESYRADGTQIFQDRNNLLFRDPANPGLNPVVVLPQGGFNYLDQNNLLSFFSRFSAEWSKEINMDHAINILGGQEIRFSNRTDKSTTAMGVIYESGSVVVTDPNIVRFFNLQNIDINTFSNNQDRFIGFFLNAGYSYKGRYVANMTTRYDGSNQLGESKNARFLPTWNVSGAWNIHNERWMDGLSFINEWKLRATYGISGNLPPNASALLNLQSEVTIRPSDVEPYLYIKDLTNTELTWEKLRELNVGTDIGLFKSRIYTSVDMYFRHSFDLVGEVLTSGIGGQSLKVGNFADMESKGLEFTINSTNISQSNFSWRTNFNVGYTIDKITRLDYGPRLADAIQANGAPVLGGPRRGLYSTRFAGLNSYGIPTFYIEGGEIGTMIDLQARDSLTQVLKYEGPTEPRGGSGLTNTFKYKNLTFSFLITCKFDYKIRLNESFKSQYTDFSSLPGELKNRWVVPGDENLTNVPVILNLGYIDSDQDVMAYQLYNKSNLRVVDGTHVRLKTVRMSYQLPQRIIERFKLSNLTANVEAQNIALLYADSRLNGQDPEFFNSGGVALPLPKTITISLNIGL